MEDLTILTALGILLRAAIIPLWVGMALSATNHIRDFLANPAEIIKELRGHWRLTAHLILNLLSKFVACVALARVTILGRW